MGLKVVKILVSLVGSFWMFFKDWANHEMVKACNISQMFWVHVKNDQTNIESDHNEMKNVYQKVNSSQQQS
jgi:hypothetical protein